MSSRPPMAAKDKQELTHQALGLLREQLEAQVVLYKSELRTSPELDAITAQVVNQLRQFQQAAFASSSTSESPKEIEEKLTEGLVALLRRLMVDDQSYSARAIPPVGRQLAKRFFEAELLTRSPDQKPKMIQHAEQGLFFALRQQSKAIRDTLRQFTYLNAEVEEATADLYQKTLRDLQVAFLSRRSPELNQAMTVFTNVLVRFIRERIPTVLPRLASATIAKSKAARQSDSVSYKVRTHSFAAFRSAFEAALVADMIEFCTDRFLQELDQLDSDVAEETQKFFTEPFVYSQTCMIISGDIYDFLCLEGFLDIPPDWRSREEYLAKLSSPP
jgi:hypothetical protein